MTPKDLKSIKTKSLSTHSLIKLLERNYNILEETSEQLKGTTIPDPIAEALADKQAHYENECRHIIVLLAERFNTKVKCD